MTCFRRTRIEADKCGRLEIANLPAINIPLEIAHAYGYRLRFVEDHSHSSGIHNPEILIAVVEDCIRPSDPARFQIFQTLRE